MRQIDLSIKNAQEDKSKFPEGDPFNIMNWVLFKECEKNNKVSI
jgi:hypothetical protein